MERKAFNFYRSFYDVLKLLDNDQSGQISMAICQVMFLDKKLTQISFKDKQLQIAWAAIRYSLQSSVDGFINKNKGLTPHPIEAPTQGGKPPPMEAPCQQGKGKEEVQYSKGTNVPCRAKAQRLNGAKEKVIEVMGWLNKRSGKNFRAFDANENLTASGRLIYDRLKSGATVEQMRAVIAIRAREWAGDDKMQRYLRPSTLFRASNFENYLGEVGTDDE